MGRTRTVFACTECGAQQPRWLGRCPECATWSSLVEERVGADASASPDLLRADPSAAAAKPRLLHEVDAAAVPRLTTGIDELDRVLGGGLVPGSVVLVAGEPGVGKSTLALQLAARVRCRAPVLYVAGEESPEQVRLRADRLPDLPEHLVLLAETGVEALAAPADKIDRRPLAEGDEDWLNYLAEADAIPGDRWALLEFVAGGEPDAFRADAATLLRWLGR